jgi:hypothetical protein
MLRLEHLAQKLTPYPLPTKDGGVLRTIGDAHAYIMALPKKRGLRAHWQQARRLLLQQASGADLNCSESEAFAARLPLRGPHRGLHSG